MTAMAVAPKSGHWFCATASRITSSLSRPDSMPTLIASFTTIALSVSMHSAMMNAPKEIRSIRTPLKYISCSVPRIVSSSTSPMMVPARKPIIIRSTTKTMLTALSKLNAKARVASVTASGWKLISPISMPIG